MIEDANTCHLVQWNLIYVEQIFAEQMPIVYDQ